MVATMWRMNGQWSRMAGVVLLCILLFNNQVMCQDDVPATDAPDASAPDAPADDSPDPAGTAAAPDATAAPGGDATQTVVVVGGSASSAAPGDVPFTVVSDDTMLKILTGGDSGVTAAPNTDSVVTDNVDDSQTIKLLVPEVTCVGEEDIPEGNAVNVELTTQDCEETKRIIQANPAGWCDTDKCDIKIFQNGNTMKVASDDARLINVAEALQSEHLKDKLGVTKAEAPSSSGSSVLVGILVSGLLAAIGITVGYFKCQRRGDTKGVRLAEEAYPVDQENQGNTLVSVAPLNPPPETPEKPSVNGESPEAAKTQPAPPTNGHSTAKTADTEL